mgnify:CR=1 FL=1
MGSEMCIRDRPWKRKGFEELIEIVKTFYEESLEKLKNLEKAIEEEKKAQSKLWKEIEEFKKEFESREIKKGEAKKHKAVAVGEEIVRKAEPKTYTSYPDSSFLGLHRTLREIK